MNNYAYGWIISEKPQSLNPHEGSAAIQAVSEWKGKGRLHQWRIIKDLGLIRIECASKGVIDRGLGLFNRNADQSLPWRKLCTISQADVLKSPDDVLGSKIIEASPPSQKEGAQDKKWALEDIADLVKGVKELGRMSERAVDVKVEEVEEEASKSTHHEFFGSIVGEIDSSLFYRRISEETDAKKTVLSLAQNILENHRDAMCKSWLERRQESVQKDSVEYNQSIYESMRDYLSANLVRVHDRIVQQDSQELPFLESDSQMREAYELLLFDFIPKTTPAPAGWKHPMDEAASSTGTLRKGVKGEDIEDDWRPSPRPQSPKFSDEGVASGAMWKKEVKGDSEDEEDWVPSRPLASGAMLGKEVKGEDSEDEKDRFASPLESWKPFDEVGVSSEVLGKGSLDFSVVRQPFTLEEYRKSFDLRFNLSMNSLYNNKNSVKEEVYELALDILNNNEEEMYNAWMERRQQDNDERVGSAAYDRFIYANIKDYLKQKQALSVDDDQMVKAYELLLKTIPSQSSDWPD